LPNHQLRVPHGTLPVELSVLPLVPTTMVLSGIPAHCASFRSA
jgi:hypothetical protein